MSTEQEVVVATEQRAKKIVRNEEESKVSKKKRMSEAKPVLVRDIVASYDDNPRFMLPGMSPKDAAKQYFESDGVKALFANLDSRGIEQPLLVQPIGGGQYQLVDGWTRFEWARQKKKNGTTVPVIVQEREEDPKALFASRVASNSARRSYNPAAEACAYSKVLSDTGNDSTAARMLGVPKSQFRSRLRLLGLPKPLFQALAAGSVTLQAAEEFMRLPGYAEWTEVRIYASTDKEGKPPSDAAIAKHERFDRAVKHMLAILFADKSASSIGNTDVAVAWDDFLTTETEAAHKDIAKSRDPEIRAEAQDRLNEAVHETRIVRPKQDALWSLCTTYGQQVADMILSGKDKPRQQQLEELIEVVGTCLGFCVAPHLRETLLEAGINDISEVLATETTQQTVREAVLSGLFGKLENEFDEAHPFHGDGGEWEEFVRESRSLKDACEALVAESKKRFKPEAKPEPEKDKKTKKGKKD